MPIMVAPSEPTSSTPGRYALDIIAASLVVNGMKPLLARLVALDIIGDLAEARIFPLDERRAVEYLRMMAWARCREQHDADELERAC